MKTLLKVTACAVALTAVASVAAPQYPFPQNKKSPKGYTIPFASTDVIKEHFKIWKGAWYQDKGNEAWILSPEGTCSTVSEAIAYGMLIMVYMSDNQNDYKNEFDKLYATWKNNGGSGAGMHWRIGCDGGTGSATDSDIDAALALVMASKQWNNPQYLNDAKSIINWIAKNDVNGSQLKPGSKWNDAFNPSYAGLANFRLFQAVTGESQWSTIRSGVANDLLACQNSKTGLVPDWCSWNSHEPTKTNASVAQSEDAGFFDDAARTPWRTAWAYYWYGDSDALTFNKKIADWLIPETKTASGINSGYYLNGNAEKSEKRNFVSSTFSGGLGLATSSLETDQAKNYMETVYKALVSLKSCASANGCGSSIAGEKYYPSTLNLLYLLLMTGNMPNLYDLNGFTSFTPDPSLMRSSDSGIEGIQQAVKDSTVGISGFWNWGAYHDKYGIGTKMTPDSGSSPIYYRNGAYFADAVMDIGPEPEWVEGADLQYPSAGIAMSFLANDKKGVNLTALGVKYVCITAKVEGPIRVAILSEVTGEAGAEPGMFLPESSDYKETTIDLTPSGHETFDLELLSWVNKDKAPRGEAIMEKATGLKFEVKDAKGGYGGISIKAVEFLDASKNVIDPVKITGIKIVEKVPTSSETITPTSSSTIIPTSSGVYDPNSSSSVIFAIAKADVLSSIKLATSGMEVRILNAKIGASYAVMSVQGSVISTGKISSASEFITLPSKGVYLVKVGSDIRPVMVK